MNFNEILKDISKNYTIKPKASNVVEIVVNKGFNAFNYYFLAIRKEEDLCILTDFSNTLKCINISPNKVDEILQKYPTASLVDETIILPYKNVESVNEYICLLDEITANKNN